MALGILIRSPYTPYSIYLRGTIQRKHPMTHGSPGLASAEENNDKKSNNKNIKGDIAGNTRVILG